MPLPPILQQQQQQQQQAAQGWSASATAAREVPGRLGAPRRAAAPVCALPSTSPPSAAGERKKRPPEQPEALLSSSWPSATVKRQVARRPSASPASRPPAPGPLRPPLPATCAPAGLGRSCDGLTPGASVGAGPGAEDAVRFSLSLTPEAVLVIQRRHLEKQLLARPRRPGPSPAADPKRPFASCPRAKAAGPSAAGLGRRAPQSPLLPGGLQPPGGGGGGGGARGGDLRALLKISLLNERHKYDDVEYEDEAEGVDEGLVRKCTEWLRGVETAAATRDRAERLEALPHLGTL
ncbi:proline-rich protein 18 [Choloepus didactylus]|uniref:proline-rich protein 18 n=1 Tax=Choloepus didactylus TaxID=27675 RepID=UPI00189C66E5|nr:proline-rich protein 18 [Choloepus didactylus]XP_037673505.1 proline-rich protein 18 [Choloepus didactylus]